MANIIKFKNGNSIEILPTINDEEFETYKTIFQKGIITDINSQDIPQKERDRMVDAFNAIPSAYYVPSEDMENALEKADEELDIKSVIKELQERSNCQ